MKLQLFETFIALLQRITKQHPGKAEFEIADTLTRDKICFLVDEDSEAVRVLLLFTVVTCVAYRSRGWERYGGEM